MDDTFNVLKTFVIEQINQRLSTSQYSDIQLRKAIEPEELSQKIDLNIPHLGIDSPQMLNLIKEVLDYSVNTNHPYFMNQMFGKTQPIAFLADLLISVLNTSMYTYEVAPVLTLIEKETIAHLTSKIWGTGIGDGVFTSGGSLSNMKAMFLARQNKLNHVKNSGLFQEQPVAIFISEQAHYSFVKGVNFMGFGTDALIKIPSKADARIDVVELEKAIIRTQKEGRLPLMLVAIAGTTISGTYDDVETLAQLAHRYEMWFHVDAAFGGALLFSDNERYKLNGIEKADSVTWNFHKAMGMPLSTSSFLTKDKGDLNQAFHVNADYLFHHEADDFDLGQKSLQGGRRPEALKLWMSLKYEGEKGFSQRIEKLRANALYFAKAIEKNPNFELFQEPDSTIVCFRYISEKGSISDQNELNVKLREAIFNEGKIIFNYAPLHDKIYLRCVLLDPDFTHQQLDNILNSILEKASYIKAGTEV
jgi:glutamate/tyrosine decarboxylase-like PLP-dependent enzyme